MPRAKLNRVAKEQRRSYRVTKPKRSKQDPSTQTARDKGKRRAPQLKPTQMRDFVCDCIVIPPEEDREFFVCVLCLNLQHEDCAIINENPHKQLRCNVCNTSELHRRLRAQQDAIDAMGKLVSEKQDEAHAFYTETLWKHYCNLPNGNASEDVLAMTQTRYHNGAMVPVFRAPEAWVSEVHGRMLKMIRDAGKAKAKEIMGASAEVASFGLEDLVHWRRLGKWLLHHGPHRGRTSELGVLAEVTGLEEKGTFWNRDWKESF